MDICSSKLCSGCSLCEGVCPINAIAMKSDCEGFLRPVINEEKCTECGLCAKKCPVNNKSTSLARDVFAVQSKDDNIRNHSSSGGVFSHIAKNVLKNGGVVFGAGYNERFEIVHKACENVNDLWELMGSKYVQSNTVGVYKTVKKLLADGRSVLFTGTPCQCAAVRNYIGDHENLILCDFVCHGVPTPKLWEKYLNENFTNVESVSFRSKKRGWEEYSMNIVSKGKNYSCSFYKDPYFRMYLRNGALRPSCYECSWKDDNYASDITLADFWETYKYHPELNDNKGISAVVIRTEKGQKIFNAVFDEMRIHKSDIGTLKAVNVSYYKSTKMPSERDGIFCGLQNGMSFNELFSKYGIIMSPIEIIKKRIKTRIKIIISKVNSIKRK